MPFTELSLKRLIPIVLIILLFLGCSAKGDTCAVKENCSEHSFDNPIDSIIQSTDISNCYDAVCAFLSSHPDFSKKVKVSDTTSYLAMMMKYVWKGSFFEYVGKCDYDADGAE